MNPRIFDAKKRNESVIADLAERPLARAILLLVAKSERIPSMGEVATAAKVALPTASEPLSFLVQAGFLETAKDGRERYYKPTSAARLVVKRVEYAEVEWKKYLEAKATADAHRSNFYQILDLPPPEKRGARLSDADRAKLFSEARG